MGKGKTVAKLTAIAAAIGGAVFFWRKKQEHEGHTTSSPAFPPAADGPSDTP